MGRRWDLAFILCCCRACLGSNEEEEGETFYDLLGLEKDATQDEIKRAYKRQSLMMHPDKLAQKGQQVTAADQARFSRMKDAYEVLADPHKRETYDVIGEAGSKWVDQPFTIDPEKMTHNFATSSTLDRSKIFAIFVAVIFIILLLPILICLQVDGKLGVETKWVTVLIPLWIGNILTSLYHIRVLTLGDMQRPEHIPEEEWVNPLPYSKRIKYASRFFLIFAFQILAALRLDEIIMCKWYLVFGPIFIHEAIVLFTTLPLARIKIMTMEEVEAKYGKSFDEFSEAEKDMLKKRYTIVDSAMSPAYGEAENIKASAGEEVTKLIFRMLFLIFLLIQLDTASDWNYWLVFTPFWFMSLCLCCGSCQHFTNVQKMAAEHLKEPSTETDEEGNANTDYGAMEEGAGQTNAQKQPISDEEKEELLNRMSQAGARCSNNFCNQVAFVILLCLIVKKLQGAAFSSMWIISPFLFLGSSILCCVGCAIFGMAPVDERDLDDHDAEASPGEDEANMNYVPPNAPTESNDQPIHTSHSPPDFNPMPGPSDEAAEKNTLLKTEESTQEKNTSAPIAKNENPVQFDLLDDTKPSLEDERAVVPTPSEVEDLD